MRIFQRSIISFLFLLLVVPVHARQHRQPIFNHRITLGAHEQSLPTVVNASSSPDTLRVLVAMVEFVEDATSSTTGDGTFDVSFTTKKIIDPPPHDRPYVQYHMQFVENYFRKVSNGKLLVAATVLDSIYRLPHQMQYYSPSRTSSSNIELGRLMQDTWRKVDSVSGGIPCVKTDSTAFMILHAGAGRDIDLTSLYGYDPTPYDIPSVYLNKQSLKKMFGSGYEGVKVRNCIGDSVVISNSMIIPETEDREIQSILGPSLLELGINGLIAASIGSHLGLPDLFNTQNGRSGIGRFGLMDGQAIFSWSGLFPPEPSAWEKYFLGWTTPITVSPKDSLYEFPAAGDTTIDTVYRVPISAKEYFLVENRNRDAHRDGSTVTMVRDGAVVQRTWKRDTTNFNFFNQDSLYGVVIDVDEFDWSLPGFVDSRTKEWYDGGILIWHIDENVINANYADDAVNANPARRGVNLMEADGSQDIGQSYGFISAGQGSEDGTPIDFWYNNNPATLRTISNEFSPTSHPHSLSNDYANSHITIKDFSDRGPRMTARMQLGDAQVKPMEGFPRNIGSAVGTSSVLPVDLDGDGTLELMVATTGKKSFFDTTLIGDGKLLAMRQDGSSYLPTTDSLPTFKSEQGLSYDPPITVHFEDTVKTDIVTYRRPTRDHGNIIGDKIVFNAQGDSIFRRSFDDALPDAIPFTSMSASDSSICWAGGTFDRYSFKSQSGSTDASYVHYSGIALYRGQNLFVTIAEDSTVFVGPGSGGWRTNLHTPLSGSPAVADMDSDGSIEVAVLGKNGHVFLLDFLGKQIPSFNANVHEAIASSPSIADINRDGIKDILFSAGSKVFAVNLSGAAVDYFPIVVSTNAQVISSPVVGDIDGDGSPDVVVGTQEGLLFAYDAKGKVLPGFPLQTGGKLLSSPTIFKTASGNVGIAVGCDDYYLYAWQLSSFYDSSVMSWPMYLHDPQHTGKEGMKLTPNPITQEFLPASRAYNWPNPVRLTSNFITHIRYYVAASSKVTVRIFDLAGDLVSKLEGSAIGGIDNEIDWNAANIQSGVYFAHIEAEGTNTSGSTVIKIAVVK